MKTIFSSKIFLILFLIIIVFIILNLTGFSKEVRNFFYFISAPIQKTFWQTGMKTSEFFGAIWKTKILTEENEVLRRKIQELLTENVRLKELKEENEFLREALNIGLEKDFQLILSKAISKDISQDSLLIDKGLKDGVSKGLPVITNQKILLGKIEKVYQDFSEVILTSNKDISFDAKISDKEIYGVVKGKGSSKIYLDLIPKDKEILKGDLVVTTAMGGIFPEGLLVGTIKEVKKSDVEPWQRAEIEAGFTLQNINDLFIIVKF